MDGFDKDRCLRAPDQPSWLRKGHTFPVRTCQCQNHVSVHHIQRAWLHNHLLAADAKQLYAVQSVPNIGCMRAPVARWYVRPIAAWPPAGPLPASRPAERPCPPPLPAPPWSPLRLAKSDLHFGQRCCALLKAFCRRDSVAPMQASLRFAGRRAGSASTLEPVGTHRCEPRSTRRHCSEAGRPARSTSIVPSYMVESCSAVASTSSSHSSGRHAKLQPCATRYSIPKGNAECNRDQRLYQPAALQHVLRGFPASQLK